MWLPLTGLGMAGLPTDPLETISMAVTMWLTSSTLLMVSSCMHTCTHMPTVSWVLYNLSTSSTCIAWISLSFGQVTGSSTCRILRMLIRAFVYHRDCFHCKSPVLAHDKCAKWYLYHTQKPTLWPTDFHCLSVVGANSAELWSSD